MATINSLLTNILQNILYCAQQKKETHTGLEQLEVLRHKRGEKKSKTAWIQVLIHLVQAKPDACAHARFLPRNSEDPCHCFKTHTAYTHSFRMTHTFHHPESTLLFSISQCALVLHLSVHLALSLPDYVSVSFLCLSFMPSSVPLNCKRNNTEIKTVSKAFHSFILI